MDIGIRNVTKRFGAFTALDNVDLEITSGELVALLGPSGSGKTTLLRIIAGLEWPEEGHILFDGEDALSRSARERHVGFVFQHYALFRHMTVFENVAFGLRVRRRDKQLSEAELTARVERLLDLVQLQWLADRYPSQLSGGQRQRIALARALAIEPRVLLLDEPFGALDAKVRKELRRWLRSLHDDIHVTSVFVTHDQEEALEVADRVVVMDKGRIEQIGTPRDVYEEPATAFVHEFIGESIMIPVSIDQGAVLYEGKPLGIDAPAVPTGNARLFIRPYDISIIAPEGAALDGTVLHIHGLGSARRVEIALGAAKQPIEVDVPRTQELTAGERVGLVPHRYRVYAAGT
ncbi:MAG: sulfate ABC transporter ATP-binding protein [Xanthobacteraceae bacterium]